MRTIPGDIWTSATGKSGTAAGYKSRKILSGPHGSLYGCHTVDFFFYLKENNFIVSTVLLNRAIPCRRFSLQRTLSPLNDILKNFNVVLHLPFTWTSFPIIPPTIMLIIRQIRTFKVNSPFPNLSIAAFQFHLPLIGEIFSLWIFSTFLFFY